MKKYEQLRFTMLVKNSKDTQWLEDYEYSKERIINRIGLDKFHANEKNPHKLAVLLAKSFIDGFNATLRHGESPRELIKVIKAIFITNYGM